MIMLDKIKLLCFVLVLNHGIESIIAQQSLRFGEKGDSGHVINFNCGGPSQGYSEPNEMPGNPGAPGKMGPIGPTGCKGSKGEKGSRGVKGEAGKYVDVDEIKTDILGMLGVTSCGELESRYGVNKTGFYQMRDGEKAVYKYCDFKIYEGATSCGELESRHGINKTGYYSMADGGKRVYNYCDFNIYEDIYTCEQLRKFRGKTTSGVYAMSGAGSQYNVHCNFTSQAAITEVWHNSMQEVKASPECEDRGCYSWTPQYDIPERSILKIIENSRECRQFIKVRCRGMMLLKNGGNPYGWWVSRGSEEMVYWGGATSRRNGYCGCGETGSCSDNSYKCNCDDNDASQILQDEGYLTDKSKLPVREIRLGDMGDSDEEGWHTLGKLECMG